jgi:YegS/Rv2252/BmrU family lipid kinase
MNEVARVLVGGRTPLGLVPAGSGNGLARELGISAVPATAIAQALTGVDRAIDGAMLGDQYFFNIAGIGLDARIARLFNERHTAARGFAKYVQTGIVELMRYKPATYALSANGSYDSGSAVFIAFANGRQYGNNVFVAPDARLDDGLLDAVMIGPSGTMSQIWRARRLFSGRLMDDPLVRTLRASEIAVDAEAELAFHCDGEIHTGPRHLVARSLPGALLVRVPG